MEMDEEYIDNVKNLIEQKDAENVKALLIDLHPADIAELCNDLSPEEARFVYRLLDNETAADVLMEMDEDVRKEFHDMAIAQQNIWLETDALGLGGVWFGIAPMEDRMEEVHSLLELPENVKVFSMFALGYPAETRPQQNRFEPERIHFIEK